MNINLTIPLVYDRSSDPSIRIFEFLKKVSLTSRFCVYIYFDRVSSKNISWNNFLVSFERKRLFACTIEFSRLESKGSLKKFRHHFSTIRFQKAVFPKKGIETNYLRFHSNKIIYFLCSTTKISSLVILVFLQKAVSQKTVFLRNFGKRGQIWSKSSV